jgi:exodeoxyribonuclease VII large subunit
MEQALLGDPKTILNRGYAIIRNSQNQVISNKAAALKEKSLVIEFKDGRVTVMKK